MNKKTIWITGGSTGIGKALAIKFSNEGWNVAISARREELLKEISDKYENITAFPLDVTDKNKCNEVFNEIKNKLNNTNVIISAADSNGFILTAAHAPFFDLEKTTHIVDLGMPRTIDPGLQNLSADIQILDLDGIKYWNRQGLCHFYDFLTNSKKITEQNMNLYEKITHNFQSWN